MNKPSVRIAVCRCCETTITINQSILNTIRKTAKDNIALYYFDETIPCCDSPYYLWREEDNTYSVKGGMEF